MMRLMTIFRARRSSRVVNAAAAAAIALLVSACADKDFTPPQRARSPKVELQITATTPVFQLSPAPKYLLVAALYQTSHELALLAATSVDVTSGTQRVTLPVDLSACLADDSRTGSKDGCSMIIAVALTWKKYAFPADSDSNIEGESYDIQFLGPYDAAPGLTPTIPPIDLSATRFGVIGWAGDDALRLGGNDTPPFVSGAISGVPGAGTAPPILFAPTQGLVFPASTGPNSFAQGPYPQLAILENNKWRRVTATTLFQNGSAFTDVAAVSATEAYAAHRSGLFRYDGSAITRVGAVTDSIFSVGSVSANAATKYVIAGGWLGVVWIGNATTQAWQRYVLPTTARLDGGVCITGPNEAFAASVSGGGLFHFDGTAWTPVPASSTAGKLNLQCPAPGQAFVIAQTGALFSWNGNTWVSLSTTGLPPQGRFVNWAVVSPTEIYAYGDSANVDRAFYRFNGTSWQELGRLRFTQPLMEAWADPRGSAYVMSQFGRVEKMSPGGVTVVSYQPSLRDVIVTSPTSAFVVGANAFAARWDGTRWSVDAPPAGTPTLRELRGVWSDGPTNAWAVGTGSAIVRFGGTGWSSLSSAASPVGSADAYNAVWGTGTDVWAVGDNSIVHCRTPASCANEASGGAGTLNGVWGTSSTNVFAVGAGGRIVRYNGTTWTRMASPGSTALYRVAGSGPNDIWAVGDSAIIHFDGTQWANALTAANSGDVHDLLSRTQPTPGLPSTAGLWVRGPREVYVTTAFGNVARYDGTRWSQVQNGGFAHRVMAISGWAGGCALAVTEGQQDNRSPTLVRGFGPTGCFGAAMTAPGVWP